MFECLVGYLCSFCLCGSSVRLIAGFCWAVCVYVLVFVYVVCLLFCVYSCLLIVLLTVSFVICVCFAGGYVYCLMFIAFV